MPSTRSPAGRPAHRTCRRSTRPTPRSTTTRGREERPIVVPAEQHRAVVELSLRVHDFAQEVNDRLGRPQEDRDLDGSWFASSCSAWDVVTPWIL